MADVAPPDGTLTDAPVAALILGAAASCDGPSPTLRRRMLHAARACHAGRADVLIPCGGLGGNPPPEAEAMRALLLAQRVPDARVLPQTASTTTEQNIRLALPIPPRIDPGFDPAMKAAFEGLGLGDMPH